MPVKTKVTAEADPEALKASVALLDRYQAALKKLYGAAVADAPYIKAAVTSARDVTEHLKREEFAVRSAAATQVRFTAAAQKADHAFRGLGTGVVRTLEGFARVALSPLQLLFPAGLTVGLFGFGAGLLGAGAIGLGGYALDRGAADVSARRRQALGLGVGYGALSSYDLNFSRFGLGDQTLAGVATGVYDVTSPQYLPLLTSGAATGDTASAAIELIKNLPAMLQGVPDQMVGPVARSRGWTNILDLQSIIRLKNADPQEVQRQIERYNADRRTLEISAEAQKKWADFDAAISRAGRKIQSALADRLAPLAEPLEHFSESTTHLIDAFINSGALTKGLEVVESGLEKFVDVIGSAEFKRGGKQFLNALEVIGPYIARFVDATAKGIYYAGRGAYYAADLAGNPNYNPSFGDFLGDLTGAGHAQKGVPPPHVSVGRGGYSIRGYAGHGADRPKYGGIIDSATGKLLPHPQFKYSPKSGGWNASTGDIPADLLAKVQASNPNLTPRQCVELVQATMGVGNVHDWRRGPSETESPEGSALATFGVHGDSDLYAYGGSGTPGIGRDHALKLVKKYPDGSFDAISQDIGHAPHLIHMPWTGRGGEGDASSYFAIFNKAGPAGENSRLFGGGIKNSVLKEHFQGGGFPSLGGVPPNAPGTPSGMQATTGWYG